MPKIWILRGLKKGILTTAYPKSQPTSEEVPTRSLPPRPTDAADWPAGERGCPTGAIDSGDKKVDLGRCVYCRFCSSAGFAFEDGFGSRAGAMQASLTGNCATGTRHIFGRSFHVMMIDVGSCNACNLEVLNLSNPYYDLSRMGIAFTNSPKHADALIVVGALNQAMVDVLRRTYESMPEPKLVLSVGACAISGGIFRGAEGFVSPAGDAIPVDVVVPGCPPSPVQILEGLLLAAGRLKEEGVRR
ncbi:MAG: NADH-quinone oxidoreductase subunit NuoB [Nitrososphaerota archaeon]|jgi:Ni,Fe-hydrogenase III small subunit|nr:NADH-quinone oxidoreductase subunit NuoB [Nitrososphaerota archaeon]MDG6951648.1 NADH-quinone oxidoreductase subunit NuoB [Nitrososphaerota archaeon]